MPEFSIIATTDADVEVLTDDQVDALMAMIAHAHGVIGGHLGRVGFTLTVEAEDMPGAVRESLAVIARAVASAGTGDEVVAVEVRTAEEFDRAFGPWLGEPPFAPDLVTGRPRHLSERLP